MILGNIIGKSSTNEFIFDVKKDAKKFQYVQVLHKEGYNVLAQIVEIEKQNDITKAMCNVLGYRDERNLLKNLRVPLEIDSEVMLAEDSFIKNTLGLIESDKKAYIGMLDGKDIRVYLDLNKLLTKHCSILAKTGSGKSYVSSVLLEEILLKNVPVIVIDPHGEYSSLKYPSRSKKSIDRFGVQPKGFLTQIQEFSPDIVKNPEARPLKLSAKDLNSDELIHLLPMKLSNVQRGMLFAALKNLGSRVSFDEVIQELEAEEGSLKWGLINVMEYMKRLNIFSDSPTSIYDMVKPGMCSIINLRGVGIEVQEVLVYKIISDLFIARKNGDVPPFFLVLEEAHNFAPERNFGEAKSSQVIRNVLSEGRKFGLGVCVISQRPARLDKSVISQTNTQIILKLTNPNDIKSVSSSAEGITSETEKEIKNLGIGTAMVVGVVDMPLFVEIRPRMTKHGGESIDVLETFANLNLQGGKQECLNAVDVTGYNKKDVLLIINPRYTIEDIKLMSEKQIKEINIKLVPCYLLNCKDKNLQFNLLVNVNNAHVVKDIETGTGGCLIRDLKGLTSNEEKILRYVINMDKNKFEAAELFGRVELQFSELYDLMSNLVAKGYCIKEGSKFMLSKNLLFFSNLRELAIYEKVEFKGIKYDVKEEIKYDIKEIVDFISKFVDVLSRRECFLMKYDVVYN